MAKSKSEIREPIIIEGRTISSSWWGKAWCDNIDIYADFDNRLPRGRNYVRSGCVVDLKIEYGVIRALVVGSRPKPYRVQIDIKPFSDNEVKAFEEKCRNNFESVEDFINGRFPDSFKEYFISSSLNLFPKVKEMKFSCSCPDWAVLCKHVAAVLYGIGRKLDDDPMLLLRLRGIDTASFSEKIVNREAEKLALSSSISLPPGRAMDMEEASLLFSVDRYQE